MNPNVKVDQLNQAADKLAAELKRTKEQLHVKQRQFAACRTAKKSTEKQLKAKSEHLEREFDVNRNIYTLNAQLLQTVEELKAANANNYETSLSEECDKLGARCRQLEDDLRRVEQERDASAEQFANEVLPTLAQRVQSDLAASNNRVMERLQAVVTNMMGQAQNALTCQSNQVIAHILQELRQGRIEASSPAATAAATISTIVPASSPAPDQGPSDGSS